jgi:hypothetical protein
MKINFKSGFSISASILILVVFGAGCGHKAVKEDNSFPVPSPAQKDSLIYDFQWSGSLDKDSVVSFNSPNPSWVHCHWNFGDGKISNSANATHVYATTGTFNVSLILNDSLQHRINKTITIYPSILTYGFSFGGASWSNTSSYTFPKDTVSFVVQEPYGTKFYWDFGDGTTSTLMLPTHAYKDTGRYLVVLRLNGDSSHLVKQYLHVIPLQTDIEYQGPVCVGGGITFMSSLSPIPPQTQMLWNFGDGTTSNAAAPQHTYSSAGNFEVSLVLNGDTLRRATLNIKIYAAPGTYSKIGSSRTFHYENKFAGVLANYKLQAD